MSVAYRAILEASQEVPPTTSTGSGLGTFVFDSAAVAANYVFLVTGVDYGPATGRPPQTPGTADDVVSTHYHNQVRGTNGAVVFGQVNPAQDNDDLAILLNADGSWTVSGRWETTDPANMSITNFAAALNSTAIGADAPLYFNVHTTQFTGGAIRGQLVAIADDNANVVPGTGGNDVLPGLAGDDSVQGLAGNDVLMGNLGNDTLLGGIGTDTVHGGLGNDIVSGDEESDLLFGNEGADTIAGGEGNNSISGGQDSADAADSIVAGSGADQVFGNGGADTIVAGDGANLIFAGFGNDTIFAGTGNDTIWGNEGNDTMAGGAGADRYSFATGSGSDQVNGFNFAEGDRLAVQGQTFTTGASGDGDVLITLSGGGTIELNGIAPGSFSPGFIV
jgi:serralysin